MALKPFLTKSAVFSFVIVLFLSQSAVAQYSGRRSAEFNSWEIGFSGGVSQFRNSINPNSDATYKKFNYWNADYNPAVTLSVIKNFSPKFSAEFEWLTTKLSGTWNQNNGYPIPLSPDYPNLPYPNPFKTGINQFALMFVPNLNKIFAPNLANDRWYLFLKGGIGATFIKEYSGFFYYDPHSGFKYALAYGGGLSYAINEKIKLKLGAMWYRVESDRLDGVHTAKPGVVVLTSNSDLVYNVKEKYFYPYIGLTYGIGQIQSKAHFLQHNNNRFLWFKQSSHRYKKRR